MEGNLVCSGARRHKRRLDLAFVDPSAASLEWNTGSGKEMLAGLALRGENNRRLAAPKPCHDDAMNFSW
jgi:hypothetical protein